MNLKQFFEALSPELIPLLLHKVYTQSTKKIKLTSIIVDLNG